MDITVVLSPQTPANIITVGVQGLPGVSGSQGPSGSSGIQSSLILSASASGSSVTFMTPFVAIVDAVHGDYNLIITCKDSTGADSHASYTQTPTGITVFPDFNNSTVRWTATPFTQ